ncbi:MAG: type ISP restriction/modification enzyme, partial [Myxococcota bacterium]|nr:type ISP restriction/modification enzyme [Myxococcota bacterium]
MPSPKDLALELAQDTLALDSALETMTLPDSLSEWSTRDLAAVLAHGLFCARWWHPTATALRAQLNGPRVLQDLLAWIQSLGADHPVSRTVQRLEDHLKSIPLAEIFKGPTALPTVHGFADIVKALDPKTHMALGVFYTPVEVVDCMIRSIDQQLKTDFGLPLGLASTQSWETVCARLNRPVPDGIDPKSCFIKVLDPASGTGIFLLRLVKHIRATCTTHWAALSPDDRKERWAAYVRGTAGTEHAGQGLVQRLVAIDIMPSSVAIHQLLLQQALGLRAEEVDALQVHSGNPLDPDGHPEIDTVFRSAQFTVILGNPPYNNHSTNNGDWIQTLLQPYKSLNGKPLGRRVCLNDDYLKFIRLGEHLIETTGLGILSFICPHGYIDGITFNGTRAHLKDTFDQIRVLDLHGNTNRRERHPDGQSRDENLFAIKQGVAILLYQRHTPDSPHASIWFGDAFGSRAHKLQQLEVSDLQSLCDRPLTVEITPDDHSFRPLRTAPEVITEYAKGFSVAELFEQSVVGIQTGCDALVIDPDKAVLSQRMQAWYGLRYADTDTLSHWLTEIGLTRPSQITRMIGKLRALPADTNFDASLIHPLQYRRDEQRWIYYSPAFLHRTR